MNDVVPSTQKRIWDLPLRIFHWLLLVLVVLQFATAEFGWLDMDWHFRFGYVLLTLLLFRLFWALIGSENARLPRLLASPSSVLDYLRRWRSTPVSRFSGHNPLGGWSTILLISALLLQAISGLATSDDIELFGPLTNRLSEAWISRATWLHHQMELVVLTLIGLHVVAIFTYAIVKSENLTASMWHGRRVIEVDAPRLAGNGRAALLLAIAVLAVSGLVWWAEN